MAIGPTPRTRAQINRAQEASLADLDLQQALRVTLLERYSGEGRIDPGTNRPLVLDEVVDRDLPLFVRRDHILVRQEDAARAEATLTELGVPFAVSDPLDCGCGVVLPVVRFTVTTKGATAEERAAEIEGWVQALHARRINASFNHVLPDGGIKGGSGGSAALVPPDKTIPVWKGSRAGIGAGVVVAVIDTGIDADAPKRSDYWLDRITPTAQNTDILDSDNPKQGLDAGAGHGTFVAGIIRQIAPGTEINVYRALSSDGIGTEEGVACAITRAWRDGANIINLSLGQESYADHPPVALGAALELVPDDVIVVASAGNLAGKLADDDPRATRPHWPAAFRRVVAVGSVQNNAGKPSKWSKRGAWVDVSTVGQGIVSTYVKGTEEALPGGEPPETFFDPAWAMWMGTSFAAPQIVGLLAARTRTSPYRQRLDARPALASLLADAYWYRTNYGRLIRSPL